MCAFDDRPTKQSFPVSKKKLVWQPFFSYFGRLPSNQGTQTHSDDDDDDGRDDDDGDFPLPEQIAPSWPRPPHQVNKSIFEGFKTYKHTHTPEQLFFTKEKKKKEMYTTLTSFGP